MTIKQFITLITLPALLQYTYAQKQIIDPDNNSIYYEGRIIKTDTSAILSWPGTSVSLQFEGSAISAIMQDMDTANYYNVILDEKVIAKIHTQKEKKSYLLASNLPNEKHTIQLFKRTEWDKGKTLFYGFELDKDGKTQPPPQPKKRKIEFFGNSITCGYAVEDSIKDSWFGYYENNYLTYAAITARHFNAQYHCTSKSGIGIVISWFPLLMPEMYNRLDPEDSTSKWNFSQFTPDIVVVNLFQNDSWLVNRPEHEQFKYRFGTTKPDTGFIINAYKNFIETLRSQYPDATIICALGSMDATREGSPWPGFIKQAISGINDPKIYTHFFPFKNSYGHPSVGQQAIMAQSLIKFIDQNIKW